MSSCSDAHLYIRFVCAKTSVNLESPQRFRTYEGLPNQGPDCKIWEAGRATTATPKIFKAMMIVGLGGISSSYIDAGLGHNNPSKEVREEAMQLLVVIALLEYSSVLEQAILGLMGFSNQEAWKRYYL